MSKRTPTDDPSDSADWQAAQAAPDAATSFAAAADLLQAALDEVRGAAPAPARPPRPADPPAPQQAPPRAAAPVPTPAAPDPWGPREPDPQVTPSRRNRNAGAAAAAGAAGAAAGVAATAESPNPAATATPRPSTGRARRRAVASESAAPPVDPGAEFDGLTDTLFEEPARDNRRRRRPAAAATAATAAGVAAVAAPAAGPALPPMPAPDEPTLAPPAASTEPTTPAEAGSESPAEPPAEPPAETPPPEVAAFVPVAAAPMEAGSRRRTKQVVAALAVAAVLIAALVIVLVPRGSSDKQAVRTGPGAQLTFDPTTTPEGAQVTRVWKLQGATGDRFVGLLEFSNPTGAPMEATYTEVIPKAIAPTAGDIRFDPQPTIVEADPVVRYSVSLTAGGTFTARYEATVPGEGPQRSRLEAWAKDLPTTATTLPPTTTTTTEPGTAPTTTPRTNTPATVAPTSPTVPVTEPPPPPPTTTTPPPGETGTTVVYVGSQNGGSGSFTLSGSFGTINTGLNSPNGFVVATGSYFWSIDPVAGWINVGSSCRSNTGATFTGSPTSVSYTLAANETVTCVFTVKTG